MNQSQALQEAKDRALKKSEHHSNNFNDFLEEVMFDDQSELTTTQVMNVIDEAMLEYSSSKEKIIEGLEEINRQQSSNYEDLSTKMYYDGNSVQHWRDKAIAYKSLVGRLADKLLPLNLAKDVEESVSVILSQLSQETASSSSVKTINPVGYLKNEHYISFADMQGETNDTSDTIIPLYDVPLTSSSGERGDEKKRKCSEEGHNLDVLHLGGCTDCGGTHLRQTSEPLPHPSTKEFSLEEVLGFANYYYNRIYKDKTHEQFTQKELLDQYLQTPSSHTEVKDSLRYFNVGQHQEPNSMFVGEKKVDISELEKVGIEITKEQAKQKPKYGSGNIAVNEKGDWKWEATYHDSSD